MSTKSSKLPSLPLHEFVSKMKELGEVIIDSYFICDSDRNIVDYNRAFHSLLPRKVARNLKGKKCYDVLALDICKDRCIAEKCWSEKKRVRLDEIAAHPGGAEETRRFIVTALPIFDDNGKRVGALELQRDVTDLAHVQGRYKEFLDEDAQRRSELTAQIQTRTRELLESNQALRRAREELLQFKKGSAV